MTELTVSDIRQVACGIRSDVIERTAAVTDREASFPSAAIKALGDSGLLGIMVPEEFGGTGMGVADLFAASEEIAFCCPSTALIMIAHGAACSAIAAAADETVKRRLLPELAAGRLLAGVAIHELSGGCMAMPVRTSAVYMEPDFLISGVKPFVTAASRLDAIVVLANLADDKPSLFVVDAKLPGAFPGKPEVALGLRGAQTAELCFDNCRVSRKALLGEGGDGLSLLRRTIGTVGRFGVGGAALGIARAVRASMTEHARSRVTAQIPLIERPQVARALASVFMSVAAVEAMSARQLEIAAADSEQAPLAAVMAKLFATEHAVDVARRALQVTGGHGYFGAAGIERMLRDALGLEIHFGPPDLLRDEVGRSEITRGSK